MAADLTKVVGLILQVTGQGLNLLDKMSKDAKSLGDRLNVTGKSTQKMGVESKKAAKDVGVLSKEVDKTGKVASKSKKSVDKFQKSVQKTGKSSKDASKGLKSLNSTGSSLLQTVTALGIAFLSIGFPVVKAAKFQRSMSEVEAISGASAEQMEVLTARAREMGATTEFSATQAADGLKYLTMAGLDAQEAFEALPGVLNLAQAGAIELGKAADIATNILSGFALPVQELARVNDVLVQTFTNTNSTLEELGYAMAYVAPIAAGLGAEFEDVTAALGMLHNAGMKGSMAGTTLRGVMARLVSPTSKAQRVLDKLARRMGGVAIKMRDAKGNWIGFVGLIQQFEEAGLTAAEAMEMLGQRAGPGLAALIGFGSDALQRMVELNRAAEGRARTISKVMHENVVGSFRAARSAIEELAIEVGNHLLPILDDGIKKITEITASAIEWSKANPELIDSLLKISGALIGIVAGMLLFNGAVATTVGSFKVLVRLGAGVTKIFTGIKTVVAAIGTTLAGFGVTISAVTAGLVVLGTVLTAFAGAMAFSDTFRDWVLNLEFFGKSVRGWVEQISAYILVGFATLNEKMGGALFGIIEPLITVFRTLKPLVTLFASAVLKAMGAVFKAMVPVVKWLSSVFVKVWTVIFKQIGRTIKVFVSVAEKSIKGMVAIIGASLIGLATMIEKIPGLAKLLGWDDPKEVTETLNKIKKAGVDLLAVSMKGSAASKKQMDDYVSSAKGVIEALKEEEALREKYTYLRKREVELQNEIEKSAKKIVAQRSKEEKALKKVSDAAKKRVQEETKQYVNLSNVADKALDKLADTIKEKAGGAWDEITSSETVTKYEQMLDKLRVSYEASEIQRLSKTAQIENQIAALKSSSAMKAYATITSMYDGELDTYRRMEEAKRYTSDLTAEERLKAEKEVEKNVTLYSQQIAEEKIKYAEKAQNSIKSLLQQSIDKEKEYTDKIIALQEKVQDARKSADEKIRELRRSGMSEFDSYRDEVRQVQETMQAAALLMNKDTDKAIDLYRKAMSQAAGLGKEIKAGEKVVVAKSKAINTAIGLVQKAEKGIEAAGRKGTTVLKNNISEQENVTKSLRDNLSLVREEIKKLTKEVSDVITLRVEIDQTKLTDTIDSLREQTSFKVAAEIDFKKAMDDLVAWQAETARQMEEVVVPLEMSKLLELKEILMSDVGLLDKLKEEVLIKISAGEELDATTQSLLQVSGVLHELSAPIQLKVDDGGTVSETEQQVLDLNAELEKLPDYKKIIVDMEVRRSGAGSPEIIPVEARAKGGLAGFPRLTNPLINKGSGAKDDVPALLKRKEYVMPTEAVEEYGVQFMEWVRNRTFPLKQLLSSVRNFNLGGLVNSYASLPRVSSSSLPSISNQNTNTTYLNIGTESLPATPRIKTKAAELLQIVTETYGVSNL